MKYIHISKNVYQFCPFLYCFFGYLLFPFRIKEEYKTNDSSTNRVADQQYIVKQNMHKFSSSPFYFQRLVVHPFYFAFFYYISFMFCRCSIFGNYFNVTLCDSQFLKVTLIFIYIKAVNSHKFFFFNSRTFHSL
jgi:hypothetical protein